MGVDTTASEEGSTALGYSTTSSGIVSTAMGNVYNRKWGLLQLWAMTHSTQVELFLQLWEE